MSGTNQCVRRGVFFRKLLNAVMWLLSAGGVALAVFCMCWILWSVIRNGAGVINLDFLFCGSKPPGEPDNGVANAILGTVFITLAAVVIGVPAAFAGGVGLAIYGQNSRIGNLIRFSVNVMMGLPSILAGVFVYALLVVTTGHRSGFAGSLSLAIILFPVVMRTTEDMILMVPAAVHESSLALGMTRARSVLCIVCRNIKGGLATGILLAVARTAGETAPLLFTALWSDAWPWHYFTQPTANLPVLINEYTTNSPSEEMHAMGWGAAFLITITLLLMNLALRFICREKKHA